MKLVISEEPVLTVCIFCFALSGVRGTCSMLRSEFPVELETRVIEAFTFENVTTLTSFECALLCSRRKLCRSVNFHPLRKECHLNVIKVLKAL